MKRKFEYQINDQRIKREYNYIPIRYIVAVLITAFEVAAMIGIVFALCIYVPYFYVLCYLTEIFCVIKIISSDDNPDYKVPWLLFVIILPVAGFMLYFIFYSRKLKKRFIKRLKAIKESTYVKDDTAVLDELLRENVVAHNQARMLTEISESHIFTNTRQTYLPLGEDMHASILEDLKKAESFIYMEYFIIEEGKFWNSILEILKEKAKAGVDVKIIYDDIGCMMTLPGDYYRSLGEYGIKAIPFSKLRGNADKEFNNRSHRKITVIDGKVGYTGGINIADRYINEISPHGHWKDTAVRLEGEAVWELTKLFLVDFGINTKEIPIVTQATFPSQPNIREKGYLIPFGDGPTPLYDRRVGKSVIQNIINGANRYVYLTTPYLIIDNDMCQTIENAALRGVDVRIFMPHIPDQKIVFEMSRSFYPRLMKAGVKIYEYEPGFVHAKSYLADDEYGMIGTINLDYRSLVHHFENGVWMYKCSCLKDLKKDMEDILSQSIQVTDDMLKTNIFQAIFTSVVRIFSPMF